MIWQHKLEKIRIALNGYGVIGKRVADAISCQDDMELVGIADIATDWRLRTAAQKGFKLFASQDDNFDAMRNAGFDVVGTLDLLLGGADIVVDCTYVQCNPSCLNGEAKIARKK